ncbi:MAG: signal recognition particle-docking protein FtsY, partial [Planctomycetia bacterium]|nr:signal recognition particle-docking protein FtsY [Planctomycetia bacterium]
PDVVIDSIRRQLLARLSAGRDPAGPAAIATAAAGPTVILVTGVNGSGKTTSIAKQIPEAPHEVLLVIDATAGQNALSQAKGFKEAAGCTGIVLSKLDGSARGGVIVPVAEQFGLPVKFVGVGESADDLEPFDPRSFVAAMLEGALPAAG